MRPEFGRTQYLCDISREFSMLERIMQVLFRRSGFDLGCHKFEYSRDAVWKSFTLKAIGPAPGFFKRRSWATSWVKGPIRY